MPDADRFLLTDEGLARLDSLAQTLWPGSILAVPMTGEMEVQAAVDPRIERLLEAAQAIETGLRTATLEHVVLLDLWFAEAVLPEGASFFDLIAVQDASLDMATPQNRAYRRGFTEEDLRPELRRLFEARMIQVVSA